MIELSVTDQADQQFSAALSGRRVTLRLRFNHTSSRWNLDLAIDDVPILHGRRVVTGRNLLAAFDFGIGVIFSAPVVDGAVPDRLNLPAGNVRLYHCDDAEFALPRLDALPPLEFEGIALTWGGAKLTWGGNTLTWGKALL